MSLAGRRVVVFKSDSHLSQDTLQIQPPSGTTLPNEDLWLQIIQGVRPKLVITTGTAGGIGTTARSVTWWSVRSCVSTALTG